MPQNTKQAHYPENNPASAGKFTFILLLKGQAQLHKNILKVLVLLLKGTVARDTFANMV